MIYPHKLIAGGVLAILSASLFGQSPGPPYISELGVVNAASRMPGLLAGGSIGRGSLFTINGVRLGPRSPVRAQAEAPQMELSGVSIQIGTGASSLRAIPLYVSEDRILALMPIGAALGETNLTVKHIGQVSPPHVIRIVATSLGIFGRQVENARELPDELRLVKRPVSSPGKTVSILVTGLGDATQNNLRILVGGSPVQKITSALSEGSAGVHRIVFEIPAGASLGCEVPIHANAGTSWSNTVSIRLSQPLRSPSRWSAW